MLSKYKKIILCYITTLIVCTLIIPTIANTYVIKYNNYEIFIYSSAISQFVGILLIGYLFLGKLKVKNIKSKIRIRDLIILISCIILISYGVKILTDGIDLIRIGLTDNFSLINIRKPISYSNFLVKTICLAIIPAFCEEYYYRVLMYRQFDDKPLVYILISSILFAIAHLNSNVKVIYFLLGIILSYIYIVVRNYIVIVILHFLYDIIQLIHMYLYFIKSDSIFVSQRYEIGSECIESGVKYIGISMILFSIMLIAITLWVTKYKKYIAKLNDCENIVESAKSLRS